MPESDANPAPASQPPSAWWARHLWEIQPVRDGLVLAAAIGLIYLGYVLSVVTVPLLIAMALAYLFEPLVRWMTSGRRARVFSRHGAAAILIVLAALVIAVPLIFGLGYGLYQGFTFIQDQTTNVQTLVKSLDRPDDAEIKAQLPGPRWLWLHNKLMQYKQEYEEARAKQIERQAKEGGDPPGTAPRDPLAFDAADTSGVTIYKIVRRTGRWVTENASTLSREALATGASAVSFLLGLLGSIGWFLFSAFLTAFFFFFICVGYGRFLSFWEGLIPERKRTSTIQLIHQMDAVIAGFIRGRLLICGVMALFYTVAFWVIGLPAPLVLGPIFGLMHLIPYAAALSVPIGVLLLLLDPVAAGWRATWWWAFAGPVFVYLAGQFVDDYILTPNIQGKTTNMDTPTILFASMAGGILAGFYGLLIAIPTGACLKILLREIVWPRFRAWGEGNAADPLPIRGAPGSTRGGPPPASRPSI